MLTGFLRGSYDPKSRKWSAKACTFTGLSNPDHKKVFATFCRSLEQTIATNGHKRDYVLYIDDRKCSCAPFGHWTHTKPDQWLNTQVEMREFQHAGQTWKTSVETTIFVGTSKNEIKVRPDGDEMRISATFSGSR